jgi:hypothetical protein
MAVAFVARRIIERCYRILENLKGENKLEDLGLGWRIII